MSWCAFNRQFARYRTRASVLGKFEGAIGIFLFASCVNAFASLPAPDRVMVLPEPREIADVELTNQDNETTRLSDLSGKVVLVFFGFTNCPDVCPAAMGTFRGLERSGLIENDDTAFVLVSVDGERDTPAAMKEYLGQFSDDFIGLTAPSSKVQSFAKQFRAAFFKGNEAGHDNHGYSVAHSNQIFLVDPAGRLRAELHNPSVEAMATIVNAVQAESSPAP